MYPFGYGSKWVIFIFVIFICNINLNIYVKCYGHRVAMYFHAPRGIVL